MAQGEFSVSGRRVVVVGAARSGIAAAELLVRRGARVTLTETRPTFEQAERLQTLGVALEVGGHRSSTLQAADLIVTSPGVPLGQPLFDAARATGIETIGELELAWRWLRGSVIAVTGTKGKSTTTTLVGRMLAAAGRDVLVGGNIGVPLSAQVEASTPQTVHVVEVSSFQLETTTTFRPWIALWLNFAADHLDRHPSIEAYAEAKARIFANQTSDDWAVVNADDPVVMEQARRTRARRVSFSPAGSVDQGFVAEREWIVKRSANGSERLIPVSAVELTGRHMLHNVIAAAAVADVAGVEPPAMVNALQGFHGLEHVMEPVATVRGVRFVNDSKATNVEAARRSIESFDGPVVAIIGGQFKGGDLRELREPLVARRGAVVAIGDAAPLVHAALDGVVPVDDAGSMPDAVRRAYALTRGSGVVVLAPACASFDWFRDYAERGRVFKDAVRALEEETRTR
ncbi:MAG TPA: UDP-N-acetylmuramoyl-L-alanine--D-glutamate ligase [Vicinamibacterales bacterium]|nr:UDP-N-acetylmuramoyl-L-alanine--D-glutamate ligase [Vicinamibacterales bacterium]